MPELLAPAKANVATAIATASRENKFAIVETLVASPLSFAAWSKLSSISSIISGSPRSTVNKSERWALIAESRSLRGLVKYMP